MRIFDQYARSLSLHAPYAPGSVAEQHDVAGHAFDGEVFIDCANRAAIRLGDHGEQSIVRNRAAARDRRQSRAAPRPQLAVDAIMVQVSTMASALRSNAFREHRKYFVEGLAREVAIGVGALDQRE